MSIYKDLNEMDVDLQQYEEENLLNFEKKKWEKRVLKKMRKQTQNRNRYVGIGAVAVLALGITISTGMISVAKVPFVAGMIEKYIVNDGKVNYSSYKTAIGSTAENEYGKMTLNEVMVDESRLVMSSTFEPAEGVDFSFKMHPMIKVMVNGKNLDATYGGETIEVNDSMFTIYNDALLKEIPLGEKIQFHIEYDRIDLEKPIENPWVFDIEVTTEKLAATRKTVQLNKKIDLENGSSIYLNKMVVTPISTVLYYDWPNEANHIAFKIVTESGKEILPYEAAIHEESYNRYEAIDLKAEKYYLVPYEDSENLHAKNPGKVPEEAILINP